MDLSIKIINHLKGKGNRSLDVDGIIIAMYEEEFKEIKVLSDKVLKTLADLKAKGVIKEYFDEEGKLCYELLNVDGNMIETDYSQ